MLTSSEIEELNNKTAEKTTQAVKENPVINSGFRPVLQLPAGPTTSISNTISSQLPLNE